MPFTAVLTGHLGQDAEVKVTNGKNVINFSVAHTKYGKNAQGERTSTTLWVTCSYWVESTAIAPFLKKGTLVSVVGEPVLRTWTTQEGKHGAAMNLTVSKVDLLSKPEQPTTAAAQPQTTSPAGMEVANTPMPSAADSAAPVDFVDKFNPPDVVVPATPKNEMIDDLPF